MTFAIFSFGGGEIFLVFLAVLVLFGANKIPELARTLGKGMNEFRKATNDIKKEFREETDEFTRDLKDSQHEINKHVREIKQTLNEPDDYEPYIDVSEESSDKKTNTKKRKPELNKNSDDNQKK